MNYIHRGHNNLRLVTRNEGKIKTYESCTDVRAWSHDIMQRDSFLREWMKSNMPNSFIPVHALTRFLETMTGRRWIDGLRAIPKCHPNCKSKAVLQSMCASCHVIKECLKNDTDFDKYFAEEEFETCNWPCERCLEVLKSIKMFWKIIIEKIFGIYISKCEDFDTEQSLEARSIQSVAKTWEKGMMKQALIVNNITSSVRQISKKDIKCYNPKNINGRKSFSHIACQMNKSNICQSRTKGTNALSSPCCTQKQFHNISRKKINKCTFIKVKTEDVACDTCNLQNNDDEINVYKHNVQILQDELISQENEIKSVKRENKSLKLELENFYKSFTVKSTSYTPIKIADNNNALIVVPKPFENCTENSKTEDVVDNIESEMIITLKNCKNKEYKHVSLLKVLHKTNLPVNDNDDSLGPHYTHENPMAILTKVQNTFGAMVKKEMGLVCKTNSTKRLEVTASFHRVNSSKSAPSCCTIASDINFESNVGSL